MVIKSLVESDTSFIMETFSSRVEVNSSSVVLLISIDDLISSSVLYSAVLKLRSFVVVSYCSEELVWSVYKLDSLIEMYPSSV